MQIIEYTADYKIQLIHLITELQENLVNIDPLKLLRNQQGYAENYVSSLLKNVSDDKGIIYLTLEEDRVVGAVAGTITKMTKGDLLEWKPIIVGRVTDLVVDEKYRGRGLSKNLMAAIEDYFVSKKCDLIRIRVMNSNTPAYNLYKQLGYEERVVDLAKRV